jgi:hypothetical protein
LFRARTSSVIVVAAAIVAVIVTAILATSFSGTEKTISRTSTVTTTQTTVVTKTVLIYTSNRSSSSTTGEQRVYKLAFQESGACGSPPAFLAAWSVTLGNNRTEAEPSNATLPISDRSFMGSPQFVNRSTIIFSVSVGTYSYSISPEAMLGPSSGNVTVRGADVVVEVNGPFFSCTTSTNSSSK